MSREPQLRHPGLDSWSRVPPETLFAFCFCSYSLGRNIPLTTSQDKDLVPLLFPEVPPPPITASAQGWDTPALRGQQGLLSWMLGPVARSLPCHCQTIFLSSLRGHLQVILQKQVALLQPQAGAKSAFVTGLPHTAGSGEMAGRLCLWCPAL